MNIGKTGRPVPGETSDDKGDLDAERPINVLIYVRLRDGTMNHKRARIAPSLMAELQEQLFQKDEIKEARIYREEWVCHKTFAEDIDPATLHTRMDALMAALKSRDAKVAPAPSEVQDRTLQTNKKSP